MYVTVAVCVCVLQEALLQRLGSKAHAFTLELTPVAPPSVQLVPAKEYRGAPIGTSYDVRAYIAEDTEAKLEKRTTVRMGIRVVQGGGGGVPTAKVDLCRNPASTPTPSRDSRLLRLSPKAFKGSNLSPNKRNAPQFRPPILPEETSNSGDDNLQECYAGNDGVEDKSDIRIVNQQQAAPYASVDKPFLLSDGRVVLEASLDKASYAHGEPVKVNVTVNNSSHKTVRRIKVFVVQHVDVCMFSNGKFKNVVALTTSRDECPVAPGTNSRSSYELRPTRGTTKNWIALEDSYNKNGASLASTVVCTTNTPEERNVFAIYVSYYVKVKISLSAMGGELSLKLPFVLAHSCREEEPMSPGANILSDDDLPVPSPPTTDNVLKSSNGKSREFVRYESKDLSSPQADIENVFDKIVVDVEDHRHRRREDVAKAAKGDEDPSISATTAKKTIQEEDMNLITNYDSDST